MGRSEIGLYHLLALQWAQCMIFSMPLGSLLLDHKEELNRCFRAGAIASAVNMKVWPVFINSYHGIYISLNNSFCQRTKDNKVIDIFTIYKCLLPEAVFFVVYELVQH